MKQKELQELKHEPVQGYRTAFAVVLAAACVYLMLIFLWSR